MLTSQNRNKITFLSWIPDDLAPWVSIIFG